MRVVLLAAGVSRRLRPLTDDRPKCLLEVGGRSIVSRAIQTLADAGLRRFTVVDGYLSSVLRSAILAEFPSSWFTFEHNADFETTNNACSLLLARYDAGEPMMMLDADIVFHPDIVARLLAEPQPNRLALQRRGRLSEEEMKVRVDGSGRVAEIAKTIPLSRAAGESVGIEVFSTEFTRKLFQVLDRRQRVERRVDEWYESAFQELIEAGEAIHAVDVSDLPSIEIDTREDLERAQTLFTEWSSGAAAPGGRGAA